MTFSVSRLYHLSHSIYMHSILCLTAHRQSGRAISSARLNTSPRVHLHPINVVVYYDPERPNLAAGFALRCIQRLSDPDVDTLRCTWRHSRQTRGRYGTVLSY